MSLSSSATITGSILPMKQQSTTSSTSGQLQQPFQQPGSLAMNASTTSVAKKKFGKNLTKIVQSQQLVAQTDTRSSIHSATSRNGLLLLSMNKKTSGLLATSDGGNGGSNISNGGHTTNTLLVSATTGQGTKEAPHLDAWGVNSSAPTSLNVKSTPVPVAPVASGNVHDDQSRSSQRDSTSEGLLNDSEASESKNASRIIGSPGRSSLKLRDLKTSDSVRPREVKDRSNSIESMSKSPSAPSAPWDEYGGRGRSSSTTESVKDVKKVVSTDSSTVDPDKEYMANKAKERSIAIQKAEELRLQEQRSRALARLRELNQRQQNTNKPNSNNQVDRSDDVQHLSEEQQQLSPKQQPNAMIHLTSYEDRDRGMSTQSSQPRMLFDPKSGSMVAVKAREEQTSNVNKPKKVSKKIQEPRNATTKCTSRKESLSSDRKARKVSETELSGKVQLLKNTNPVVEKVVKKVHVPQPLVLTRTRRSLPRTCGVLYRRSKVGIVAGSNNSPDDTSALVCADGCDGDLGYGAHSVPGGRFRNPVAYAKFKQSQQFQQMTNRSMNGYRNGIKQSQLVTKNSSPETWDNNENLIDASQLNGYSRHRMYDSSADTHLRNMKPSGTTGHSMSMLYTGFVPSQTREPVDDGDYEMEIQQQHIDWVTADDKLELVGMDDDEPTLKPTAKAFAPSQAALAAAATLRTQESRDSGDDDEEDASNEQVAGLHGFDDDIEEEEDDFLDDEEIDEHHHHTVNKAALDILDDDDDDLDDDDNQKDDAINGIHHHHHHLSLDDPLVFGFDAAQDIHELIPPSSKAGKSRLVQLEELPLESGSLVLGSSIQDDPTTGITATKFGTPGHPIFPFTSSNPWGTNSVTSQGTSNNPMDWNVDILNLARGGVIGGLGIPAGGASSAGGLFGSSSENAFGVHGLVGGIPSRSAWSTSTVPAFEGLTLNSRVSGVENSSSKGGD